MKITHVTKCKSLRNEYNEPIGCASLKGYSRSTKRAGGRKYLAKTPLYLINHKYYGSIMLRLN